MTAVIIENAVVATVDGTRSVHRGGHVVIDGPRIVAVGPGPPPALPGARRIDGTDCLVTPGLVNTHTHLFQWATRGMATEDSLPSWLTAMYPMWTDIDTEITHACATAALAWLARTGCTTSSDHHYVFPRNGGDLLAAEIAAASAVGLRFHPSRGSMNLGHDQGGLPPNELVEDIDAVLSATESAIATFHDPAPESMVRIAMAPCSLLTASSSLLSAVAELARSHGVRLHMHLAETANEVEICRERFNCSPTAQLANLGWLGPDVWLAHAVHVDDQDILTLAMSGTAIAHCPSSNARLGSGICRLPDLRNAGIPVGLGVDGGASNEAGSILETARHALLFARARNGPDALTPAEALELATRGGAAALGRESEIGSLEPGKLADLAVWRLDSLPHANIADPLAALILGSPPPLKLLLVNGRVVVEQDRVITVDETQVADAARRAHQKLMTTRI